MLSERLRFAMQRSGLSQAELARACGVKAPSVHNWLSGRSKYLRGQNLLSAAKALNVAQNWLATGHGPISPGGNEIFPGNLEYLSLEDCLSKLELSFSKMSDQQRTDAGHLLDLFARRPSEQVKQLLLQALQNKT